MNQTFNMNRWTLLINMHWSENKKKYFLSLAAIAGLLFIWYGLVLLIMAGRDTITEKPQVVTYYVGLILTGCFYASVLFSDLSNRPRGINYLMLPASTFEKMVTTVLFGLILYFICYTIVFYLVDISMVKLSNSLYIQFHERHNLPIGQLAGISNVFVQPDSAIGNGYYMVLMNYVLVQAIFMLGSVYFPRYSFILTIISLLIIIVLLMLLVTKVYLGILPEGAYDDGFSSFVLRNQSSEAQMVELPRWTGWTTTVAYRYLLPPVLWAATYFRLKEKQV